MDKALNVLLVEDSEDDAELLVLELRRGGLAVTLTRVETQSDFREALISQEWDLVLSDYNLPSFNAPDALKVVLEIMPSLPFIIISGAVSAKDAVTLLKAGAHDFIEKGDYARLVPAIERELREASLRREHDEEQIMVQKLFRAVEQSPISTMITDAKGRLEYVNPQYEKVSGFDAAEVLGQLPDVMTGDFVSLEQNAAVWDAVNSGREWRGEFCNTNREGQFFWENVSIIPIKNDQGTVTNLLISKEDITFKKEAEEKLYRQANFDNLTHLPNRELLLHRLGEATHRYDRVALMTIDMDNFKKVNDSLGHVVGDQLLVGAAKRLRKCLKNNEVIGRISGDEFAVVLHDAKKQEDIQEIANEILKAFSEPFNINDHELFVTISAGISLFPDDDSDPAVLFKNAEGAMGQAKDAGRNRFRFYTANINEAANERIVLEAGIRKALEREELKLFYQPIVDGESGQIIGAEALIRWFHPEQGMISPDRFIPLAEETGAIVPIGQWVIETACDAIRKFHQNGNTNMYVAVNVSPQQILSQTLVSIVENALKEYEIPAQSLVLEVTENVCIEDTVTTFNALKMISDLGVRLAVDDFGTGYSSLSYLKQYPFDILKIDRAFIDQIPEDEDDVVLVNAMLAMGHSLGLRIVAEGVEHQEHLSFLTDKGCDYLQGYFFSKPVPYDEFVALNQAFSVSA